MKRVYYDLHIHSCLSPCGDNDMTPYNLVNMAALNGLDVIALTDHNSCKNCAAAMQVGAEAGITVIPGVEVNTSEEIHTVCLFPELDAAMRFDALITSKMPDVENVPEIFGNQYIMDCADNVIGEVKTLLINACNISIMELPVLTAEFGGVCFPAHIDKSSYSVLSNLGAIPTECGFHSVEISKNGDVQHLSNQYEELKSLLLLNNSDAHYLENIAEKGPWLFLEDASAQSVIAAIKNGTA